MVSWFVSAALLGQIQPVNLGIPPKIDGAVRLAKTPALDGKVDQEEWEFFSGDGARNACFQWEPESLYWSCEAPKGQDAVLSLDLNADGWLVGRDNVEIRVSFAGTEPLVQTRILDATTPGSATWRENAIPVEQVKIAAAPSGDGGFVLESSFIPTFGKGPQVGKQIGVRIDNVAAGVPFSEPFVPRGMAYVFLQYDSSRDLPSGVSWRPTITNRSVAYLDPIKLVFGLTRDEGSYAPSRIEVRGEGSAKDVLASIAQPAPAFSSRGKLDVGYESVIAPGATPGWRVVRASFKDATGSDFAIRSSIRLADLVDIELGFPAEARSSSEAQIIRGNVILRSQYSGKLQGVFSMTVPAEWSVSKGKEQNFLIYHTRGTAKIPVEFIVPRGQTGVFPLSFKAKIGDNTVERRVFFGIE